MPPEALAAALRDGLEARRYFRPPATPADLPPPAADALPRLDYFRRLADRPVPPGRVPVVGGLLKLARRAARKLVNPWLVHQTEFNEAACANARAVHQQLAQLTARLNALQRELTSACQTATARTAECTHDVARLWAAVRPDGEASVIGLGDRPPQDPPGIIQGLFLHTRIGPPPGRVLVCGPAGSHALDLAGLGFQVVLHAGGLEHPAHPGLNVVADAGGAALPFPDASFDRVVVAAGPADAWADAGSDFWREAARVLAPGGRLIASRVGDTTEPAAGPLKLAEAAFAHRAGHGWALTPAVGRDTAVTLWVAEKV